MKTFKYLICTFIAAFVLVGCSDDPTYTPGEEVDGPQVYFPENTSAEYNVGEDVNSITIPVLRVVKDAALTVAIQGEDLSGLFTFPSSVTFAPGSETANLVITFDPTKLLEGMNYPVSFLISDEDNRTPYGFSSLEVTIKYWPWKLMPKNNSIGRYRDDVMTLLAANNAEIEVKIYEHKKQAGIYMVEDMYNWNLLTKAFGKAQGDLASTYSYVKTNVVINASNPNAVIITEQLTGVTTTVSSLGALTVRSIANGKMVDGVIAFPVDGLVTGCKGTGNAYYANTAGMFRIILPGSEATDYSLTAKYRAMTVPADGGRTAGFDFTYGADVTGISYVIAEGDVTASKATIASGIVAGTVQNVYSVENFIKGDKAVSIEAELTNRGVYTIVALPKDKTGKLLAEKAVATKFSFPGMDGGALGADLALGTYSMKNAIPESNPNTFVVSSNGGSKTKFIVKNIGISNNASWHATYDNVTSTLTLDGTLVGYEQDGNRFATGFGYFDANKTQIYAYFSYADPTDLEAEGTDPLVFAVDPTSGKITELNTEFEVVVFNATTGAYVRRFASYEIGTPVTRTAAASSASVASEKVFTDIQRSDIKAKIGLNLEIPKRTANNASAAAVISTLSVKTRVCDLLPKEARTSFEVFKDARPLK